MLLDFDISAFESHSFQYSDSESEHYIKNIFDETEGLLKQKSFFKKVKATTSLELQLRLCKWLVFLNNNQSKQTLLHNQLVEAVEHATRNNEIFKSQTSHELEISFSFFESIFRLRPLYFLKDDLTTPLKLLTIALVYSRYPGMQVRSVQKAFSILETSISEENLEQFFVYLFVKYENPKFFTSNLELLNTTEIGVMMHLLQGNNIRTYPHLPMPISKKESFLLMQNKCLESVLIYKNLFLSFILVAKLLKVFADEEYLVDFLQSSRTYKHNTLKFAEDFAFWKETFRCLKRFQTEIYHINNNYISLNEVLDYIDYKRYKENDLDFFIKGKNINDICFEVWQWHQMETYQLNEESLKLNWNKNPNREILIHRGKEYLFEEIGNAKNLFDESVEMKHCVFSYLHECAFLLCTIWSVKIKINDSFKRLLTIEISDNQIHQVRGKCNRKPTPLEKKVLREWMSKNGMKVSNNKIC
jgi:hypothetical protein